MMMTTECDCWRKHAIKLAKGISPPPSIDTLQAAWERDQEVIFDQKKEIGRLKLKLNQARSKNPAKE